MKYEFYGNDGFCLECGEPMEGKGCPYCGWDDPNEAQYEDELVYPKDFINQIICGDCLEVVKDIPDKSVDMVITSPPYWKLRSYSGDENQLGLEPFFKDYINNLIKIFDAIYTIVKDEGSLWINIGDTYYGGNAGKGGYSKKQESNKESHFKTDIKFDNKELSRKSLCNIPARFSILMQEHKWLLRNIIIWHKPNAFVTSAKDRFTVDFEYLYWFVKQPSYYFKQQFEPFVSNTKWETIRGKSGNAAYDKGTGQETHRVRNMRPNKEGRNKRCVWSINTQPVYGLKHFAKYPEKLIEIPILATCPNGGIVLDPFMGSGTTGIVAKKLGKNFIGIDISEDYCNIARERLSKI